MASAEEVTPLEAVQVTMTRVAEEAGDVPADITVISGAELRARGARDLRTVLSLVSGVEAPPGGDTGPAGAVPSFLGLHEFDAFLLVVDGVPWGGAFNPSIPTLDLDNVERVEVLKGAAPVMYGATSFVGVIQIIRYAAGAASNQASLAYGSFGSKRASISKALAGGPDWRQSLHLDAEDRGYSDPREVIRNSHLAYRAATELAGGEARLDADVALQRQIPPSPVVRQGAALSALTALDANFNPSDARVDENRYHVTAGYSHATPIGNWQTTASLAQSTIADVRGFLRPDLVNDGSANADSQNQRRRILDVYVDTHIDRPFSEDGSILYGFDLLYGLGRQDSTNGSYFAALNGAGLPATTQLHVDEVNRLVDRRLFLGQFAQIDWKLDERWDVLAGARVNETAEQKSSVHVDGFDPVANATGADQKRELRLSGTLGISRTIAVDQGDRHVLFADMRAAFKPSAIDFGPDYTPAVLNPETADSAEAGIKGTLDGRQTSYALTAYAMTFRNLVLRTTNAAGSPVLQNAGGERLEGIEGTTRHHVVAVLDAALSLSYHRAHFTSGVASERGTDVSLAGHELTLSPHLLSSAALLFAPPSGPSGSLVATYVGRRYLDLANQAPTPAYLIFDATIDYRVGRFVTRLSATNLFNRRPPVTQSEFGDSSYYLFPGRRLEGTLAIDI